MIPTGRLSVPSRLTSDSRILANQAQNLAQLYDAVHFHLPSTRWGGLRARDGAGNASLDARLRTLSSFIFQVG